MIDVSVLLANPKFACTGERIIQKTQRIWAGGNSTRLFTNLLTASPLVFTASLLQQKHSRAKSRQLRRLRSTINNRIPSKRGFKIASLNVNKLSTHIDEIKILLADKCLDVLAIQETKLGVSNNNSDFYICGYELIRRDRLSDGGGGICFYIKSTINFSVRTDLNIDELENLWIEIRKPNSRPFIVVNWYRPPNSPTGLFPHLEKSYCEA